MNKAPLFTLPDQDGTLHTLADYRGKKVLLYFYPKDMTEGCTIEAEGFRDAWKDLATHSVVVLGVSVDSVDSHKKFCDKHALNFPLLSDEKKEVVKEYGVWVEKSMYGKKYMGIQRDSFLIDEEGTIIKHYVKVKPEEHPREVLKDVENVRTIIQYGSYSDLFFA
ncbi:MAG: Bacterioferritin comigratory protein [Parcubacteria group bacterium GW2011_GWA2_49_16]|nr:MAG: Bacterioferritin comigratory protein [Parcubacteria group bacterium GW2011_GWA2_49_16]